MASRLTGDGSAENLRGCSWKSVKAFEEGQHRRGVHHADHAASPTAKDECAMRSQLVATYLPGPLRYLGVHEPDTPRRRSQIPPEVSADEHARIHPRLPQQRFGLWRDEVRNLLFFQHSNRQQKRCRPGNEAPAVLVLPARVAPSIAAGATYSSTSQPSSLYPTPKTLLR